jgi:hypothetical protein
VYFVATGGFYRMIPGGLPECLSRGKFDAPFTGINRTTHFVHMQWDRDNQGCMIYITARTSGASTHYWWDARTEGIFPWSYPDTVGPISSTTWDGDGTSDRYLLMGTRNGYVVKLDTTAENDHDGTAISSNVLIGPILPFGDEAASVMTSAEITMGELADNSIANCTIRFMAGFDEYIAQSSPRREFTMTYSGSSNFVGRRIRLMRRQYGGAFYIQLANTTADKSWSFERVFINYAFAGRRRRY